MASKSTIRLQIHVDAELAQRLERLAQRMNRKTSWMIAELLIQAVMTHERFLDWMAWRVVKLLGSADPRNLLAMFRNTEARPPQKGTVYLQTSVSPEIVASIEKLANANQRSRADMTTVLLNWVIDDEQWLIEAVTTRWYAALHDGLGLPRGQQDPHNHEDNTRRAPAGQPHETSQPPVAGVTSAAA